MKTSCCLVSSSIVFVSFFLFSCSSQLEKADAERVDSLITVLDSASFYTSQIDTIEVKKAFDDFKIHLDDMQKYMFDKPGKEEDVQLITRYSQIRKPLRDYKKNAKQLRKSIDEQKQQLLVLKKERLKGIINDSDFVNFFHQEKDLAKHNFSEAHTLHQRTKESLNTYYELNERMIVYMDSVIQNSNH